MTISFKRNYAKAFTIGSFILVSLIGCMLYINSQASLPSHDSQGNAIPSLAPMLEKVTDAVVNISTTSTHSSNQINDLFNDPLFRRFFGQPEQQPRQKQTNLGSGVIINAASGYVITNNHVIEDADNIKVTLKDGRKLDAELIGNDQKTDIALLKITSKSLVEIPMANSDSLRVGDFAVAIGNPFGLGQTVTSGIISALGRNNLGIEGYEDFIQTDASINPGNSGGALVNLRGELIGINTAILSKSGGNVGIGFAIPINMANNIMQQIIDHGEVKRGVLGVHIQDLTADLAKALKINRSSGVIVAQVINNSAAEKAGLKNGDIIIQANNKNLKNAAALRNYIGLMRPGESVKLKVIRGRRHLTLNATISGNTETSVSSHQFPAKKLHPDLNGAYLSEHNKLTGLEVSEIKPGTSAWETGLKSGDRIISINRQTINNIEDLEPFIKAKIRRMAINILRGNTGMFLVLE